MPSKNPEPQAPSAEEVERFRAYAALGEALRPYVSVKDGEPCIEPPSAETIYWFRTQGGKIPRLALAKRAGVSEHHLLCFENDTGARRSLSLPTMALLCKAIQDVRNEGKV